MSPRPPESAWNAWSAARALDREVSALGHSLPAYSNWSLVDLLTLDRQNRAHAATTLRAFAEFLGAPADALRVALRDAQRAYREPAEDVVANAFWSHGIRGWPPPREVRAWRYGALPPEGRSYNYRDRFWEPGVSVAFVDGAEEGFHPGAGDAFGMFFGDRRKVWVRGFLREDVRGSDGEPLLVGARRSTAPRGALTRRPAGARPRPGS